jgi:hypothetical protein
VSSSVLGPAPASCHASVDDFLLRMADQEELHLDRVPGSIFRKAVLNAMLGLNYEGGSVERDLRDLPRLPGQGRE